MMRIVPIALLVAFGASVTGCTNADYSHQGKLELRDGDSNAVNGSIDVRAGTEPKSVSTVNGSISAENEARLTDANTVNGRISLGARATATSLTTVNGPISLDDGVKVAKDVTTVNGGLTLNKGADVGGKLENVNGTIRLTEAHVGGGIQTTNGDIEIGKDSKVEGGIKIEREGFGLHFGKSRVPRVVIAPGAVVDGPLTFERKVTLYVSDSATIGPVSGAEAIKFSGDEPPAS